MATKLDKDLIRETTVVVDDREVLITLGSDQSIKMKLKGMKSGEVSIDISQLYDQLSGRIISDDDEIEEIEIKRPLSIMMEDDKPNKGAVLIDLNDLRSMNAISMLDTPTLSKFDGIITDLIKQKKDIQVALNTANRPTSKNSSTTKKKNK